jgi:hypothetical protein
MDVTTRCALRAIVHGLHASGAITADQAAGVAAALIDAAEDERRHRHGCVGYDLAELAKQIHADAVAPEEARAVAPQTVGDG